jgi:putative ABC transport system ATP-binding protein
MELLTLDGVGKRFHRAGHELVALDNVSLRLFAGDYLAVLGSPRSGKTTLLRVAAGIERPDTGTASFMGRNLAEMSERERTALRRHDIGCVWADLPPNHRLTAVDHVALPLVSAGFRRSQALARANEYLRRVGADGCAAARLHELSASEAARVSIAQAIVREPKLLLADEPTDVLNSEERRDILAIMRSIARDANVAVLMTAGDAAGALRATRFGSLKAGRLVLDESAEAADVVDLATAARRGRPAG